MTQGARGQTIVDCGLRIVDCGLWSSPRSVQSEIRNPKSEIRSGVGQAKGMVECVPDEEMLLRGGYEATLCGSRRLAPAVEDLLVGYGGKLIGERAWWRMNDGV